MFCCENGGRLKKAMGTNWLQMWEADLGPDLETSAVEYSGWNTAEYFICITLNKELEPGFHPV